MKRIKTAARDARPITGVGVSAREVVRVEKGALAKASVIKRMTPKASAIIPKVQAASGDAATGGGVVVSDQGGGHSTIATEVDRIIMHQGEVQSVSRTVGKVYCIL